MGDIGGGSLGCSVGSSAVCDSRLTDDALSYDGSSLVIAALEVASDGALQITFDSTLGASAKQVLTLHVGSGQFPLANASASDTTLFWTNPGLSWSVGDTVEVKLTGGPYWTGVDLYGGGLVHHSDGAQTLDITSESGSNNFLVRLDQAPTANVTITLQKNFTQCSGCGREYHGDVNAATVSPKTLTFTTSNWQTGQTVTVTGVPDSDSVHEHLGIWAVVSIASGADSDDPYRNPERVNGVWVTIRDGSDAGSDHGGL